MTSLRLEKPEFGRASGFAAIAAIYSYKCIEKRLEVLADGRYGALSYIGPNKSGYIAAIAAKPEDPRIYWLSCLRLSVYAVPALAAALGLACGKFSLLKAVADPGAHESRRSPGAAGRCSAAGPVDVWPAALLARLPLQSHH